MKTIVLLLYIGVVNTVWAQVGINTITPNAQLEITASDQAIPANTDGVIIPKINVFPAINPTGAQQSMLVYLTTVSGSNQPGFYYWDNPTTTWKAIAGTIGWSLTGNAATVAGTNFVGTTDNVDLVFDTNATERMRIKETTGNIGIGIVTPSEKLHVFNNVKIGQNAWGSITNDRFLKFGDANFVTIGEEFNDDTMSFKGRVFTFNPSVGNGFIGVGLTTPQESIHTINNIKIGSFGWGSALDNRYLKFGDGNFTTIGEEVGDDIMSFKGRSFIFNPSIGNGFVGIGVTTPLANLHILNPQVTDTDVSVLIARNNATAGSTWSMGSVENYTEGYVNIGFSSTVSPLDGNNVYNLGSSAGTKYNGYRWGTLFCSTNPNVSSDITLKKDIKPLLYGLAQIRKINPISYIFKTEKLPNGKEIEDAEKTKMLGFSAQELQNILPEVVSSTGWKTTDEKTYTKEKTATLGDIIPVAINAIKELDLNLEKNILELNSRIKYLEEKNILLENRIKAIEEKLKN
jgi:Chaperone of endosialidase